MRDFPPVFVFFFCVVGWLSGFVLVLCCLAAFLRWFLRFQWPLITVATLAGGLWQLPLTVGPLLFGKAVDHGIRAHSASGTLFWAGLLLAVTVIGAAFGIVL